MRDKLNSNPLAQMAVIAVLLIGAGIFLIGSMGGGEEESESSAPSPTVTATVNGATATGSTPGAAVEGAVESLESGVGVSASASTAIPTTTRPLPGPVLAAWEANKTVVLLFVHDGGIDDELVRVASSRLATLSRVALFVVPAKRISAYAAVTEGVGVDRVPALVVMRPRRLDPVVPTASVSYGFQSGQSIVQAVIDAGYEGPTVDYHP